jgi:hypothetical protein
MGLDKKDLEMMAVSVPVVNCWEMKEELDRFGDCVERLEKVIECLVDLYHKERVKNWETILNEMLKEKALKRRSQ